ncbi:hypothetical protein RJ640_016229 [Escallonia rubra]|uniref:Mediator of RNA polymerase II transcription subunit 17 n=1 Tax=Escallonia rubra TaxID=112253 RepID=A0AA88UAT6_9ASTE|nr:hypothetical protein RJ640_016229 [Escallonia rubra]
MDGDMEISVDKLPIKRLEAIEENGAERFPSDVEYEEKRVKLIRRVDFAWAVEREDTTKKQKQTSKESAAAPWPWQSMLENLQSARQELSVILDLINTVEANDAATVAGMTRPKPLPNELLSDLAVSTATKLQSFRHLGKYFKQSAKALEQQVAREARFYGALISGSFIALEGSDGQSGTVGVFDGVGALGFCAGDILWASNLVSRAYDSSLWVAISGLQRNWKVKRHRMVTSPGNEGFYMDLFDNSLHDPTAAVRPSSATAVRVQHDTAGMLAVNLPPHAYRALQFGFLSGNIDDIAKQSSSTDGSAQKPSGKSQKESMTDDECIKETHSVLREVHRAIFDEQVFDLVNREAFNPSLGVNLTGIRENYLQLSIGQEVSVFISIVPSRKADQIVDSADPRNSETELIPFETFNISSLAEEKYDLEKKSAFPTRLCCEIYLQQMFHEHVFVRGKRRSISKIGLLSAQSDKDGPNLLGHFCMSVTHRIFSNKVLKELENLVRRVPYLYLVSQPTWHSRTSSWTLFVKVPQSILHAGPQMRKPDKKLKSQFQTKVVVNDDCIHIEGEGAPNVAGLFKGKPENTCSVNRYDCDLADLTVILLQQIFPQLHELWAGTRSVTSGFWGRKGCKVVGVASQVIRWLHEEALMVGIKASRDFLCLSFELEQGETLGLVAHVDPEETSGCISWWLVMHDGFTEARPLHSEVSDTESRKFLGHLSLDVLYSTLLDLVCLCSGGGRSC